MFQLADPHFLFLLLFIPLLIFWRRWLKKRSSRHIGISGPHVFPASQHSLKIKLIQFTPWIEFLALALLVVALSRPRMLYQYTIEKKQGIDILVTLDISGSMASIDFTPRNRLEVAKQVISDFISERTTDRIGLVVFAGTSYTKCPLTVDYNMLDNSLKDTEIGELEDGTALGMALATAVNRIRHSPSASKVIILLTDGVNNRGEIDPRDAASIASDLNIKVYTIGVGRRGQARYPVTNAFGRRTYAMVNVEIDEELLREMAQSTGGLYFRATDNQSLKRIFTEINRWEKSEIKSRKITRSEDLYLWFLLAGLALLWLMSMGERTFLRTLP